MLSGKTIIFGVTGSIAAIKSPIVARELMRHGANVVPVLTKSALEFTTATALSALTHSEAITEIFPSTQKGAQADAGTWHIRLARSADAMLIAPCSAKTIGLLAHGIYENAVTLLAASLPRITPLIIAPAMDEEMWLQPAVQKNLETLRANGVQVIEPVHGALASGLVGMGRMPEPADLITRFVNLIAPKGPLAGKHVLVTGGPTHEPIDAVRFIGNRSSGKMAAALAAAAARRGARVELVMGPSAVSTNGNLERINVETAEEMRSAVMSKLPAVDVVIMSAAVADLKPTSVAGGKLKKREIKDRAIALEPTPDILYEIALSRSASQLLVGFALEKSDSSKEAGRNYALAKLAEKKLDMIVLNDLADAGAGFGHDTNQVTMFIAGGGEIRTPLLTKQECAERILDEIEKLLTQKS